MARESDDTRNECHAMLLELKSTVEGLLGNHTTNVWNTYGGLSRLTNVVNKILKHKLKIDQHGSDCWNFILGLRVLMPTSAPWLERHRLATEGCLDRSYLWLQQRLQEHTLSSYLKVLLEDSNHLIACYQVGAFLRQVGYGEFLLTCLIAVENNQLSLLTELDPNLLVDRTLSPRLRSHMRRPSLPTSMSEISLQFHTPSQTGHGPSNYHPFTNKDNGTYWNGVSSNSHLYRTRPVDPLKATYYRERCCNRRRLKSDFAKTGAIPKSITWDGISSSNPSFEIAVNRRQKVKTPNGTRQLSKSCMCLCPSKVENSGTECLPDELKYVANSLPCILNASNIASLSLTLVKNPCQSFDEKLVRKTEVVCQVPSLMYDGRKPKTTLPSRVMVPPVLRAAMKDQCRLAANSIVEGSLGQVDTPPVHRSPSHSRSKSDVGIGHSALSSSANIETVGHLSSAVSLSSSLPANLQTETQSKSSFDEESSTPIFRRPVKGQSLTSFLSSQDFRTCTELDKENAHFSISEALIAAIEQIKCNQMLKIAEEEDEESDDEEIKHLKQRIRIRRRERLQEKVAFRSPHLLSDGYTDTATTTTSQTPSPRSTSSDNKSDDNSSDSIDPIDLSDGSEVDSKLGQLTESGLSLSMASLYSDADIQRPIEAVQPVIPVHDLSDKSSSMTESLTPLYTTAESVALNLLRRFSEKQLPKASDLEWLVSEQDAPQKLLPLPTSWPISPDDAENIKNPVPTRLRGNFEWAPPRQQIIFNVHPAPQRKVIMAKQNYRCAGCGAKVEQGFVKRFRYCEYLGKYFCQCCHNNSLAYIPGHILCKWDFNKYYVSNFSRDLLKKIAYEPLYNISDINTTLYRRVKVLHQVLQLRLQLLHLKDFVRVCRKCTCMAEEFEKQPSHLLTSPHLYSLHDLVQVKTGEMLNILRPLVKQALQHIAQCELCQAQGFFCGFCKNDEVIFPFQLEKVTQCPTCWSCYHCDCFIPEQCPKCIRIEVRKRLLQKEDGQYHV